MFFKIIPLIILAIGIYIVIFREKCHIFEPAVHLHLGTKNPYRNVANLNTEPLNYSGEITGFIIFLFIFSRGN